MPTIQPAELWQESGRWAVFGPQMLKIKDRHERDFLFGPTHEEVITDLVRREVRSYRELPLILYQIQTKFRDEIRPRFGLMRGREFIMKDAYSFDVSDEAAQASYQKMYDAYARIFARCGLKTLPVEADTGVIGGNYSHEFMVPAETGENEVAYCESGGYAANLEKASSRGPLIETPKASTHSDAGITRMLFLRLRRKYGTTPASQSASTRTKYRRSVMPYSESTITAAEPMTALRITQRHRVTLFYTAPTAIRTPHKHPWPTLTL